MFFINVDALTPSCKLNILGTLKSNQRNTVIGVVVKPNEPFERALKRFTKSCEKNGIISDVKRRQRFEKPSEEKKRTETAARRKRLKEIADQNRKRLY
jgi:small subunit ribosomal protein S21